MADFVRFLCNGMMLKLSISGIGLTLLFLVWVCFLWFFKRPLYRALWSWNPGMQLYMCIMWTLYAIGAVCDFIMTAFPDRTLYFTPAIFFVGNTLVLLLIFGSYLIDKGIEFRSKIPEA